MNGNSKLQVSLENNLGKQSKLKSRRMEFTEQYKNREGRKVNLKKDSAGKYEII